MSTVLMEKVRGLQNLAYQLGWEEGKRESFTVDGEGHEAYRIPHSLSSSADEMKQVRLVVVYITETLAMLLCTCLFPATCLLIHLPRLPSVWLFSGYPSSMQSNIIVHSMHVTKVLFLYILHEPCLMYPSNETGVRGFVMLTMTAPSRITMRATCGLTVS